MSVYPQGEISLKCGMYTYKHVICNKNPLFHPVVESTNSIYLLHKKCKCKSLNMKLGFLHLSTLNRKKAVVVVNSRQSMAQCVGLPFVW